MKFDTVKFLCKVSLDANARGTKCFEKGLYRRMKHIFYAQHISYDFRLIKQS